MKLILAQPRGFCAGVERAIGIVNRALELFSEPIYVRHEVVHNRRVVDDMRARGVHFINEINEVPDEAILIFSAHGVSQSVVNQAQVRQLKVFDATCPLVTKVHMEVCRYATSGRDCILIGHRDHPEVEGTMGQYQSHKNSGRIYLVEDLEQAMTLEVKQPEHIAYVTQTTLSVDDTQEIIEVLKKRFSQIVGPAKDDICYATQNRQDAVKELARECDLVLVVGSPNSSNSNRLREIAERGGCEAYLIDEAQQLESEWLRNKSCIGLTAGASAPEDLVNEVVNALVGMGADPAIIQDGKKEQVYFSLPKELRLNERP
jgi:4-hydroxy-3-methylbut-2-enyl diphosphate reductase